MVEARWTQLARVLDSYGPRTLTRPDCTRAAVLVPVQLIDGELHLVYTRRAQSLPHHRGQIAFPGGTSDPTDDSLEDTALREAHEEIGLAPQDVCIFGRLSDIETLSSRFLITPIVGRIPHPYAWAPSADEVDIIFTVPIRQLLAPETECREIWDFGGHTLPIDHFPIGGHVIWGATHRITRNLLTLLEGGD